jgi:hypothetical protein
MSALRWSAALLSGLALLLGAPAARAQQQPSQSVNTDLVEAIYGFACTRTADNQYVIALGPIARPSFAVMLNPMSVPPLQGSGLAPVAQLRGPVGGVAVAKRCTSIATRLSNLAMATDTATPLGILTLSQFLRAGVIAGQPVISIGQLALPDVLATLPLVSDPQQDLQRISERIRQVATAPALAEVLVRQGLVEFVELELD